MRLGGPPPKGSHPKAPSIYQRQRIRSDCRAHPRFSVCPPPAKDLRAKRLGIGPHPLSGDRKTVGTEPKIICIAFPPPEMTGRNLVLPARLINKELSPDPGRALPTSEVTRRAGVVGIRLIEQGGGQRHTSAIDKEMGYRHPGFLPAKAGQLRRSVAAPVHCSLPKQRRRCRHEAR